MAARSGDHGRSCPTGHPIHPLRPTGIHLASGSSHAGSTSRRTDPHHGADPNTTTRRRAAIRPPESLARPRADSVSSWRRRGRTR
jgi:hypothetical protein